MSSSVKSASSRFDFNKNSYDIVLDNELPIVVESAHSSTDTKEDKTVGTIIGETIGQIAKGVSGRILTIWNTSPSPLVDHSKRDSIRAIVKQIIEIMEKINQQ